MICLGAQAVKNKIRQKIDIFISFIAVAFAIGFKFSELWTEKNIERRTSNLKAEK